MKRFDIARGQWKAWSILSRSHTAGRGASTYLLYGPPGVGHWSLSVELTALLNCASPIADSNTPGVRYPCGDCRACRSVFAVNFEGFLPIVPIPSHKTSSEEVDLTNEVLEQKRREPFSQLDSAKALSIPIDRAREIKRSLAIRAGEGITRVVLFYQMDKMRAASADALLKLIEEPPPSTVIILTTAQPEGLLPTLQSRSQKIRLERLPEAPVVNYLVDRYQLSEARAKLAYRIADGSLGRAIRNTVAGGDEETDKRAVAFLLFKALVEDSAPAAISRLHDLVDFNDRGEAARLVAAWQSFIRDCAWFAQTGDVESLVNIDFETDLRRLSPAFADARRTANTVIILRNTLADFERSVHIQPALSALMLRLKAEMA